VNKPPAFLSAEFHLRFFPTLLAERMRPQDKAQTGFRHFSLVLPVTVLICFGLLGLGLPEVVDDPSSIQGWVFTILGGLGLSGLLVLSIASRWGEPVSYERFEPQVFLFVLILGTSVGVFCGRLIWALPPVACLGAALAGALVGYVAGIGAGLWCQVLGPAKDMLLVFAIPGMVGLVVVDLVLLVKL
jgi:hypothetical protein